jgi:hypothetical protein
VIDIARILGLQAAFCHPFGGKKKRAARRESGDTLQSSSAKRYEMKK